MSARTAVAVVFVVNGFAFASWVSRIPAARERLGLGNGELGLLLLALSVGSLVALPLTGALVRRFGAARVLSGAAWSAALGLVLIGTGAGGPESVVVVALGLLVYGVGTGSWDVAMNIEGAAVEHALGRTIMPRFHAGFSLGTVLGAVTGALAARADVPALWHLGPVALVSLGLALRAVRDFLPVVAEEEAVPTEPGSVFAAWREPRTLLIGLMVLALAFTEGTANDWLGVALVDGYAVEKWVGVAGFAVFVVSMTLGRWFGSGLLDRFGRVAVLRATILAALVGVALLVSGAQVAGSPGAALAVVGIALWGLGASLGFPVGMSAAGDDPVHAAARVSVVSTIGYAAFLAGPPVLGFLADRVGTLEALLAVAALLVPAALVVPAARREDPATP
ncbi:MFS transporter [Nocardioides donggukensis]|uniref:MFS transporter n=1 Tax=Nocardioides donggukensis TaxID=2774019 RepID=A0A927Q1H2_9ACTN|nr:MFS transporter [Nocardioides donggukensis]MBD8870092.1 MFS transporter [Nocardioides donggukensis]